MAGGIAKGAARLFVRASELEWEAIAAYSGGFDLLALVLVGNLPRDSLSFIPIVNTALAIQDAAAACP